MNKFMYETMYIVRPDLGEEQTELAIATYQNLLRENGGEIIETQHRGKRPFSLRNWQVSRRHLYSNELPM